MKDLFIDNNVASRFTNPLDPEYKKLIVWLLTYDPKKPENNAYLVLSKKLIGEYSSSTQGANTSTCIPVIINKLIKEGRRNFISNERIKEFQAKHFTKKVQKHLRSNNKDREYIPLVLLSERKFAITIDDNFVYDLTHFPGFTVKAEKRPELLPYI